MNGKLYGTQEDGGQSEQQSNKANGETAQANGTTTQLGEVGASLSEGKISGEDQAQLFLQSAEMIKKCFEDIGVRVLLLRLELRSNDCALAFDSLVGCYIGS